MTRFTSAKKLLKKIEHSEPNEGIYLWPEAVEDVCKVIETRIYEIWRFDSGTAKAKRARVKSVLKPICYGLTRQLLTDEDEFRKLEQLAASGGETRGRPVRDANPFKTCLKAIFIGATKTPTAIERLRIANELMFAYRHFIPANELERFLGFYGGVNIASKLQQGYIDPLFKHHVAYHLSTVDAEELKLGAFPDDVLDLAEEYAELHAFRLEQGSEPAKFSKRKKRKDTQKKELLKGWA